MGSIARLYLQLTFAFPPTDPQPHSPDLDQCLCTPGGRCFARQRPCRQPHSCSAPTQKGRCNQTLTLLRLRSQALPPRRGRSRLGRLRRDPPRPHRSSLQRTLPASEQGLQVLKCWYKWQVNRIRKLCCNGVQCPSRLARGHGHRL